MSKDKLLRADLASPVAQSIEELARAAAEKIEAASGIAAFLKPGCTKDDAISAVAKIITDTFGTAPSVQSAELRKAAESALEWFAGFPHMGGASGFDISTAMECYNKLSAALATSTRDEGLKEED